MLSKNIQIYGKIFTRDVLNQNADFKTVCETIISVFLGKSNCQVRMQVLKQKDLGLLLVMFVEGAQLGAAWGGAMGMRARTLGKHLLFAV